MAILDYNFMSQALLHPTTVKVVMPTDNRPEYVMYFLHGVLSDAQNCIENMDVQTMADKHRLAIIIPSCGNSFYIDHGFAFGNYGQFVGNELVEKTRAHFPIPQDKEHTIIAGFSMGGYGAIRNGVKYHKNFGTIIGLSAACLYEKTIQNLKTGRFLFYKKHMFEELFGEKAVPGEYSENYRYLIERELKKGKQLPFFYLSCGREEELCDANNEFAAYMKEKNLDYKYVLAHGQHNWELWSVEIEKALEYVIRSIDIKNNSE